MKVFNSAVLFLSSSLVGFTAAASSEKVVVASNSLRSGAAAAAGRGLQKDGCISITDAICGMQSSTVMCDIMTNLTTNDPDFLSTLNDEGKNFTIFVPEDQAWNRAEKALEGLRDDEVGRIFAFHFYENITLSYDDLECSETLTSMTLQNDTSRTKCDKGKGKGVKHQNGSGNTKNDNLPLILTKDVMACNAALHSVDHLLLPVYLEEFTSESPSESPTDCSISWKDWKNNEPACDTSIQNCVAVGCSTPLIPLTYDECLGLESIGDLQANACKNCHAPGADASAASKKDPALIAYYCFDPMQIHDVTGPLEDLCLDSSCATNDGSVTYIWGKWYCSDNDPCYNYHGDKLP